MAEPADDTLRDRVAGWVVALGESHPPDPEVLRACRAWCDADPRHADLFAQMSRMWGALAPDPHVAPAALRSPGPTARRRLGSGGVAGAGALCLVLLGAVVGRMEVAPGSLSWSAWTSDLHTAVGEMRRVALDDGSSLTLNSDSAVDLEFTASQRLVRLQRGEVFVDAAGDSGLSSLRVVSPDGVVVTQGVRYAVRREGNAVHVAALADPVLVQVHAREGEAGSATDAEAGTATRAVRAGEQWRFGAALPAGARQDGAIDPLAWRPGRLVFHDVPVDEVLRELRRYRPGLLGSDALGLHGLRFTGVLPADRPDDALALLQRALPIRIARLTRYVVWVRPSAAAPSAHPGDKA